MAIGGTNVGNLANVNSNINMLLYITIFLLVVVDSVSEGSFSKCSWKYMDAAHTLTHIYAYKCTIFL